MTLSNRTVVPSMSQPPTASPVCRLVQLPASRVDEAVDVLAEAFQAYPVMLRVLGQTEAGGATVPSSLGVPCGDRLQRLVRFFVLARVLSGHPILALEAEGRLLAAATMSLPGTANPDPDLEVVRAATWAVLGPEARARYDALGQIWSDFSWPAYHHHLNMIGVRREAAGRGLGRRLLDEVHALAAQDPKSRGVSLTTETASNVDLYRHMGYRILSRGQLPADGTLGLPEIRSWGMFRPTSG